MELYDEDDVKKGVKGKKIVVISLIAAIIILITVIMIIALVPKNIVIKETLYLNDGKQPIAIPEGLFYTSEDQKEYISISDFAKIVGYEYYRGEYTDKYTEDSKKCYVQSSDEATSFILGLDNVYKTDPNNDLKYEYYTLTEPVIMVNNKLYASLDAVNIAFNSRITQNKAQNSSRIYTLPYLYNYYEENYSKSGYTLSTTEVLKDGKENNEIKKEQSFQNQKALVYNMAVVNRNNKFGVTSTLANSAMIIGTKYDKIDYIEERQEFIVTSGKKQGVLSDKGETVINLNYDSIELLDGRDNYYLVSQNSKYGILKSGEEIVVPLEFNKIYYRLVNNKKMYYLETGEGVKTLDNYLGQA